MSEKEESRKDRQKVSEKEESRKDRQKVSESTRDDGRYHKHNPQEY